MSSEKQIRALVVDDHRVLRMIHSKQLAKLGVITYEAENGKEAVELCCSGEKFDIILMDYEMPMMNGPEATRTLREMGVTSKIVGITAQSRESEVTEFLKAGIDEYQEKPLNKPKLVAILKDIKESTEFSFLHESS